MRSPIGTIVSAAVIAVTANTVANAGSFSLYTESSAAAIGNYAAGVAAEAADASTGWYNPAGLSLLHQRQGVLGLVVVSPSAKLSGISTFSTLGPIPPFRERFTDIKGGKMGYVPSGHIAYPVGPNTTFGLSMVAPFGLATDWDPIGPVRYQATSSHFITSNLSPELGSRITEHFAVGAGIDLQFAHVRFNRVLGSPDAMAAARVSPFTLDSYSNNKGNSFGVGFHAGVLALFNEDHTRLGVNYQSQMRHHFYGYSLLQGRLANISPTVSPRSVLAASPAAEFRSDDLESNTVRLPDVTTLSAYQDVTPKLALLGSAVYTGWHTLKTIELNRVAAFAPTIGQVFVSSESPQHYRDVWRFALGANYHINPKLMLRVGGGYDETPTRDEFRDIRVPDSDRWAASVGFHYQVKPTIGMDFGYTHLFSTGNARINRTDSIGASSQYNVNADVKAHANLFGIQAVWTLDQPMVVSTKVIG
ncbi:MAG: outer membrane protein transport protein [Tatlockia sp.]|nr:outer membrane protein transport protein [Tatlockia sp.]